MDAELFAAQVSDLLGAETVSMSVTPRVRAVIDRLGAPWDPTPIPPHRMERAHAHHSTARVT